MKDQKITTLAEYVIYNDQWIRRFDIPTESFNLKNITYIMFDRDRHFGCGETLKNHAESHPWVIWFTNHHNIQVTEEDFDKIKDLINFPID